MPYDQYLEQEQGQRNTQSAISEDIYLTGEFDGFCCLHPSSQNFAYLAGFASGLAQYAETLADRRLFDQEEVQPF